MMHIVSSLWLTLRNNSLAGFEIISSHLGKLENLDLSYNIFNDNILSHLHGLSSLKSLNLSGNMLLGSTTINGKVVNISWHLLLFTSFLNNIFWNLSMLHFFMIGLKTRSRSHLVSLLTWLPVFNSTHHRFKEAGISAVIAIPEDPISQRILI
jgi:hypothetical protein